MTDLHRIEFWDMGHELFRTTPETFPVPIIVADIFDPSILEPVASCKYPPKTPIPALSSLTSLNPLRGHISVIHASYFFHLFSEEKQLLLAQALAGLLSPEPGSVIFGTQVGHPGPTKIITKSADGANLYCDSPESWRSLWIGPVFEQSEVEFEVTISRVENYKTYLLEWSVTRT